MTSLKLGLWLYVVLALFFSIPNLSASTSSSTYSLVDSMNNIRKDPMGAIDRSTLQVMTYMTNAKSIHLPMENNQSVHVLEFKGEGLLPPIVLLHGISSCASDYYPLIRCLQTSHRRVIAIDLPGHGETIANPSLTLPELEHLMLSSVDTALKALKVGRCVLCGNSLGGFVATRYAATHSRMLSGLVLISPAGAPLSEQDLIKVQQLFRIENLGDAVMFLDKILGSPRIPYLLRRVVGWFIQERLKKPSVKRILAAATIHSSLTSGMSVCVVGR